MLRRGGRGRPSGGGGCGAVGPGPPRGGVDEPLEPRPVRRRSCSRSSPRRSTTPTRPRASTSAISARAATKSATCPRAIQAGEVSPSLGPDATLDALVGPIVHRAFTGSSIPHGLVDTLVEGLLKPRPG
ncbi:TetR-like C-terminal domain-containing protein [Saccharopolyspora sp. NPDC050642]|uniref:TetR-like C-terminal domain-containing protein n=1 Tax=Saccharopolyspora sp. NPDC050642 TaxID=3157099 RepID=UPI00340E8B89